MKINRHLLIWVVENSSSLSAQQILDYRIRNMASDTRVWSHMLKKKYMYISTWTPSGVRYFKAMKNEYNNVKQNKKKEEEEKHQT